jgi:pSer/pThr/pTyr-binding forkhead associated (FHA) protein
MSAIDRFETFMENLVEGSVARLFRSPIQPAELAKRLERAMEANQSVGPNRVMVPNLYRVFLHPQDHAVFAPYRADLEREMAALLGELAQERRFGLRDIRNGPSQASTSASPFGNLVVVRAGQSGVSVGKMFPLGASTIIGRSMDQCEIALNDSFLSQQHARLDVRGDDWVLEDLGSTNGTFLNDVEVRDAVIVTDGDILRFGRVELRLMTAR